MTSSSPHMVMAVGNAVTGDSRVEKAASSARSAGYRVTIVGIKTRDSYSVGAYKGIPILRMAPDWTEYNKWRAKQPREELGVEDKLDRYYSIIDAKLAQRLKKIARSKTYLGALRNLPHKIFPEHFEKQTVRSTSPDELQLPLLEAHTELKRNFARVLVNLRNISPFIRSGIEDEWRRLWPQIVGFEEAFLKAFRLLKPDVIHVHDRHPMSAADIYAEEVERKTGGRVPWVYDAHEYLPGQRFTGPAQHRYGWLAVEEQFIKKADDVITVSAHLSETLMRRHHLSKRPQVVENAPSIKRLPNPDEKRRNVREEIGLDQSVPILTYVGKLSERRGIYTAVEALAQVPDAHLVFVGSKDVGPRQKIRTLAQQLGLAQRVHIVEYVPSENVTDYIKDADIGLSPLFSTKAHHQALPTKIREYIQAGLAIVGSDLTVQGHFIRETNIGHVHASQNAYSLSKAIVKTLTSLQRHKKNAEALRPIHSWEGQEPELVSTWRSVLGSPALNTKQTLTLESSRRVDTGLISETNETEKADPFHRQPELYLLVKQLEKAEKVVAIGRYSCIYVRSDNTWVRYRANNISAQEAVALWEMLVQQIDVLVLADLEPLFDSTEGVINFSGVLTQGLAKAGVEAFYFSFGDRLHDPDEILTLTPDSWLSDLLPESRQRLARQRRRARQTVSSRGIKVRSDHPFASLHFDDPSSFISVSEFSDLPWCEPERRDRLRIGIYADRRATRELSMLESVREQMSSVDFIEVNPLVSKKFEPVDIFVDVLGSSFPSLTARLYASNATPTLIRVEGEYRQFLEPLSFWVHTSIDTLAFDLREQVTKKLLTDDEPSILHLPPRRIPSRD